LLEKDENDPKQRWWLDPNPVPEGITEKEKGGKKEEEGEKAQDPKVEEKP